MLLASDWAETIESSAWAKNLLRQAVLAGHKVGFHHHDCGHANPDGYIADHFVPDIDSTCSFGFSRQGTVAEAFAPLQRLQFWLTQNGVPNSAPNRLNIAAQGPDGNEEMQQWEWQSNNIYATGAIDRNSDGHPHIFTTVSTCHQLSDDGLDQHIWNVPGIGHAQIDVGSFSSNGHDLDAFAIEMFELYDPTGSHYESGAHLGMVFHAREFDAGNPHAGYESDRDYIEAFFDEIEGWGERALAADDLLRADAPCGVSAAPGQKTGRVGPD